MSFLDVDDSVPVVGVLGQHGEVVVGGEVSALDVELVEDVVGSCVLRPHLLDVRVLQLVVPVVVVSAYLFAEEAPVGVDGGVNGDDLVAHCE